MSTNYGVRDILSWKFPEIDLPQEWAEHLGTLPETFRMYVEGDPGHGKTEYMIRLSKMLATCFGKVHYNNVEQGKHLGIQQSVERNDLENAVRAGKWMYGRNLIKWDKYLKKMQGRNSGRVLIIDSISYWGLTYAQIKELHEMFPRKSLIFVAYACDANKNKPISHLCDIKVVVKNFEVKLRSRFGGLKPMIVYPEGYRMATGKKPNGQLGLEL